MEVMALMNEIGMTAIRLRVWVNPQKYGYGAPDYHTLDNRTFRQYIMPFYVKCQVNCVEIFAGVELFLYVCSKFKQTHAKNLT